jgi:halocyanin-like protein
MNTDEGMNRRDFLRITGASAGVVGVSGTAAAQGGNKSGGNKSSGKKGGGNKSSSGGNKSSGGGGGSKKQGPINYNGWLEGAKGWGGPGSTVDKRGSKKVTIKVGPSSGKYAFSPTAVHIDPGTKVTWKWVGSGSHNVQSKKDAPASFKSDIKSSGTFTKTIKKKGIIPYFCQPHKGRGMKAALAVGGGLPRKAPITPATPAVSNGARTLGVATFISMVSTLGLAYFFIRYGGDYEE